MALRGEQVLDLGGGRVGAPEALGHVARDAGGPLRGRQAEPELAALQDRAPEQRPGLGNGHEAGDRVRARGLAHHRDLVRVAPEGGDAVAHPAQGGDLVEQAEVAVGHLRRGEPPQHAEAVAHVDRDDVALAHQSTGVVPGRRRRPDDVGAAVQPHEHGARDAVGRRRGRGAHVDAQAVLVLRGAVVGRGPGDGGDPRGQLRRGRPPLDGLADAGPRLRRGRRGEARRRGVADAEELDDVATPPAAQHAVGQRDRRIGDRRAHASCPCPWCSVRCSPSRSRPKSWPGSRHTEWAWLTARWVLSHSASRRGPCSR